MNILHIRITHSKFEYKILDKVFKYALVSHIGQGKEMFHYHCVLFTDFVISTIRKRIQQFDQYKKQYQLCKCDKQMLQYICKKGHKLVKLEGIDMNEYLTISANSQIYKKQLQQGNIRSKGPSTYFLLYQRCQEYKEIHRNIEREDICKILLDLCKEEKRLVPSTHHVRQYMNTIENDIGNHVNDIITSWCQYY